MAKKKVAAKKNARAKKAVAPKKTVKAKARATVKKTSAIKKIVAQKNNPRSLPKGFKELEPFVADWALSTMTQRLGRRVNSTGDERRRFYAAMAPRAGEIIDYLNAFPLDTISEMPENHRLLQLMLSLAEISLTEEVNGQEVEAVHAQSNRLMLVPKELDGL